MSIIFSHFSQTNAVLGAAEERTKMCGWHFAGVPQASDKAMRRQHWQSQNLWFWAGQCGGGA